MTSDLAPWFVLLTALIVVGGFFSASETALFSSNRLTLRRLSDEGDRRARVAHRLLQDPGELLTTLLVGNTIADIGASVLATSMAIRIIGRGHGEWAAFVTVTLIVLIFSEIAPKTLAARRADRMALWVAEPIQAVGRVLGPLIRVLSVVATTLIRPFGAPITTRPPLVTEEQLRFLVEVGEEEGVIEEEEREMIHSIFEMGETLVREVMRPRIDIIGLPSSATIDEALGLMIEFGHTRLPVYEGSVDHITGVVYVRDVLPGVREGRLDTSVLKVLRPAFFVPETKKVDELFREMQRKKVSMAIVLDEYGGTEGLVTMEDILEEIVGEIQDEHDLEEKPIQIVDDHTAIVNGPTHIHEVNDVLDLKLPDESGDVDTVAGLIYQHLGRVPQQGETITVNGVELRVERTIGQRIAKVRVSRLEPDTQPATS